MSGSASDPSFDHPKSAAGPLLDLRRQLLQSGDLDPVATIEILQADQVKRWLRGERIPAETYLHLWAELPASNSTPNSDVFCDLIYAELLLRQELGENPPFSEYLCRFPQFAPGLVGELEHYVASGLFPGSGLDIVRRGKSAGGHVDTLAVVAGYQIVGAGSEAWIVYQARQIAAARSPENDPHRRKADPAVLACFRVEAEAASFNTQIYLQIGGLDTPVCFMASSWCRRPGVISSASGQRQAGRTEKSVEHDDARSPYQHGILHAI